MYLQIKKNGIKRQICFNCAFTGAGGINKQKIKTSHEAGAGFNFILVKYSVMGSGGNLNHVLVLPYLLEKKTLGNDHGSIY